MPDPRSLLYIPQSWPFPDAAEDTFIAPEMPHLQQAFARVIVAPLQGDPHRSAEMAARLPAGCELDTSLLGTFGRPGIGERLGQILRCGPDDDLGRGLYALLTRSGQAATVARIQVRLADLAARHRPSLTCTTWFHAATLAACALGLRCATRAHGFDLYEERHPLGFQPLRRRAIGRLALVACVSDAGRRHLEERHPGLAAVCETHRLGVPSDGVLSAWDASRIALVSCSAVVPVKRVERIARIVHEVARSGQRPVHWTHLGDGPEMPALRSLVDSLAHPLMACDLPGAVPADAVRDRLRSNGPLLYLNQSSSEGVPVGAMEALSCGIPVCATAVGGVPEIIDEAVGIIHAADMPPTEVAAGILALAQDDGRRHAMTAAAQRRWHERCDPLVNHTRFAARLRAIAADPGIRTKP